MTFRFSQFFRYRPRLYSALGALGFTLCGGIGWMGSEFFLVPKRRSLEPRHLAVLENPADFGLALSEDFEVKGADGAVLRCLLISPETNPGIARKTRTMRSRLQVSGRSLPPLGASHGTIVMLHGRGGIREDAFPVAERFVAAGFRCLIYDSRAHGTSGGKITGYGAFETADLSAVIDGAEERFGKANLGPFVGFGISLGSAVLIQALPEEPRLKAGVAVSPFAELPVVMHQATSRVIHPAMPPFLTHLVVGLSGFRGGFSPSSIRPVEDAAKITVPMMIVHGELDQVIPIEQGKSVFQALPESSKRWRFVKNGYHRDVLAKGGDDLYQEMIEFFLDALGERMLR